MLNNPSLRGGRSPTKQSLTTFVYFNSVRDCFAALRLATLAPADLLSKSSAGVMKIGVRWGQETLDEHRVYLNHATKPWHQESRDKSKAKR